MENNDYFESMLKRIKISSIRRLFDLMAEVCFDYQSRDRMAFAVIFKKLSEINEEEAVVIVNHVHSQVATATKNGTALSVEMFKSYLDEGLNIRQKVQAEANDKLNSNEIQPLHLTESDIEKMIVTIRGEQVLIDRDLAYIYQVEVKQMNRQVKRNIERFPGDFMFQLTKDEYDSLKCQNGTSNTRGGDRRALPYAFTQQGIGMLSGLLRSQVAIDTNIRIMRAFVNMRRILIANMQIAQRLDRVELQQLQSRQWMAQTEDKISMILDKIEERHPKLLSEQIFGAGCIWDAWAYVSELVRSAKVRIELIDNFVDDRVLALLMKRGENVSAIIHSRFTKDFLADLEKHNKQYPKVEFKQIPHKNHDRFLIIDDAVYLLGASVKDMGNGMCAITKLSTTPETIIRLLI